MVPTLVWLLFFCFSLCSKTIVSNTIFGAQNEEKMSKRRLLRRINRPGLKTIQSPDGDIINCVLINETIAFDHPQISWEDHKEFVEKLIKRNMARGKVKAFQVWHMANESCPEGSVPIRKITKPELHATESFKQIRRKSVLNNTKVLDMYNHEHAIMVNDHGNHYGLSAILSVWKPFIEEPGEFSLAQLWLASVDPISGTGNTIEVGWQVFQAKYSNEYPKLFVFWTNNNYYTGCYNLECPGFIQVHSNIVLGSTILHSSSIEGPQQEISIHIIKEPVAWILYVNGYVFGYFPLTLFNTLREKANRVHFGGEVINSGPTRVGRHTTTQMGSGHFADEGYRKAAYIRNIQVLNVENTYLRPQVTVPEVPSRNCYNVNTTAPGKPDEDWGLYFYYGGPGFNEHCR